MAKSLDHLAELNRNNQLVKHAIIEYENYLAMSNNFNDTEFQLAAERCIERIRFIGKISQR